MAVRSTSQPHQHQHQPHVHERDLEAGARDLEAEAGEPSSSLAQERQTTGSGPWGRRAQDLGGGLKGGTDLVYGDDWYFVFGNTMLLLAGVVILMVLLGVLVGSARPVFGGK